MVNDEVTPGNLLSGVFSTPAMDLLFSDAEFVQQMVRVEAALSAALEECGLAPVGSAVAVAAMLESPFLTPQRADLLRRQAPAAGNLAIPFVKLLTAAVAERDPRASAFLHTGATSQDILDTALVLQLRAALAHLRGDSVTLRAACACTARLHAETILPGRTWLQQAPPVTLGLKLAGWAAALDRHIERLDATARRSLQIQFGGAVGTLASLGSRGIAVSAALARRLDLPEAPLPWHTHRDPLVEVATTLGLLVGSLGKMARDIALMMQTEVAEVFEPAAPGRGASSTMPHKRNPVAAASILAAATRVPGLVATMLVAMPQEHERGLGGWHAEWETLPEIVRLAAAALAHGNTLVAGLEIHPDRMAANLAVSGGLVLAEAISSALAPHLGRSRAHALLEAAALAAVTEKRSLRDILRATPEVTQFLDEPELARLLDPAQYLGSTRAFIARALGEQAG